MTLSKERSATSASASFSVPPADAAASSQTAAGPQLLAPVIKHRLADTGLAADFRNCLIIISQFQNECDLHL
jgi:hypothetical protein